MSNENEAKEIFNGPYRATKLWNSIIFAFRTKMPLKKHRRQMRIIDNCFSASNAVDWLHSYLCQDPNFGPDVSRNQTIQLLQKLKHCHVFESIVSCKRQGQTDEFKDNRDLYRFVSRSPFKTVCAPHDRAALRTCTNNNVAVNDNAIKKQVIPECQLISRQLSVLEVENTWKAAALGRLQAILKLQCLEGILDMNAVNPKFIIHNMTKITESGVVSPLNRTEELPQWLQNAMKCLMSWPKASGADSCLPKYSGFENDVFKVVRDFFENLEEPLIPFGLYNAFIAVIVSCNRIQNELPLTMTPSMEELVSRMTKAWMSGASGKCCSEKPDINSSSCPDLSALPLWNPVSRNDQDHDAMARQSESEQFVIPCFETAFLTANPVTRMVNHKIASSSDITPFLRPHCSMSAINTHCKLQDSGNTKFVSVDNLNLHKNALSRSVTTNLDQLHSSPDVLCRYETLSKSRDTLDDGLQRKLMAGDAWCTAYQLDECPSSESLSSGSSYYTATSAHSQLNDPCEKVTSPSRMLEDCKHICKSRENSIDSSQEPEAEKFLVSDGIQICLLLLSPDYRRKLHLLLSFMHKVANNNHLHLSSKISNRELVLNTFTRGILRSHLEADYDEQLAVQLVSFLMDNYETVLKIPRDLKTQVEDRLAAMTKSQIKYDMDCDASTITYCEQVTKEEYERQRLSLSEQAIADLLNSIITDPHLSKREKHKKLRQFKKLYPAIYAQKFPQEGSIYTLPLFSRSLHKLRSMRM